MVRRLSAPPASRESCAAEMPQARWRSFVAVAGVTQRDARLPEDGHRVVKRSFTPAVIGWPARCDEEYWDSAASSHVQLNTWVVGTHPSAETFRKWTRHRWLSPITDPVSSFRTMGSMWAAMVSLRSVDGV